MQALTAAASSGNMDLLDWMMSAFNVTLTGDSRVGVHVAYKVIQQCAAVYSVMCSHHSVESAVQPYIGHGSCGHLWHMHVLLSLESVVYASTVFRNFFKEGQR